MDKRLMENQNEIVRLREALEMIVKNSCWDCYNLSGVPYNNHIEKNQCNRHVAREALHKGKP